MCGAGAVGCWLLIVDRCYPLFVQLLVVGRCGVCACACACVSAIFSILCICTDTKDIGYRILDTMVGNTVMDQDKLELRNERMDGVMSGWINVCKIQ